MLLKQHLLNSEGHKKERGKGRGEEGEETDRQDTTMERDPAP